MNWVCQRQDSICLRSSSNGCSHGVALTKAQLSNLDASPTRASDKEDLFRDENIEKKVKNRYAFGNQRILIIVAFFVAKSFSLYFSFKTLFS